MCTYARYLEVYVGELGAQGLILSAAALRFSQTIPQPTCDLAFLSLSQEPFNTTTNRKKCRPCEIQYSAARIAREASSKAVKNSVFSKSTRYGISHQLVSLDRTKLTVHQDYSLRAKDHKKKQTVLKSLKQKAAERNEDEFYFGMVSRGKFSSGKLAAGKKWDGTVAGDRGNKALDMDTVRLLKTQDIGYLRTVRNVVAKEVRELEQKAVIAGAFAGVEDDEDEKEEDNFDSDEDFAPRKSKPQSKPKKIVFATSGEELEEKLPEPADSGDDMDMDDDGSEKLDNEKDREARKRAQNAERLRQKLRNARKKLKALTDAENELELQRARMAKTATVGSITKRGQKIKVRERKK